MRFSEIVNEAPAAPQFGGTQYSKFSDLKAAIASEWGNIPELERVQISRTGSNRGITFGRVHLINPKNKKVVGYWETTGADLYPGRGLVTTGYGAIAIKPKKAAGAAKPVKPAKIPAAKAKATPEELASATQAILTRMKQKDGRADYRQESETQFSARYWGDWEVPADEEDDGDYDWKVITDQSSADLDAIQHSVGVQFPTVAIEVQGGEKEWLYVSVKSRK